MWHIAFKTLACNEIVIEIYFYGKAVSLPDVVENRIEDDEQFFIKVDAPFLRYRVNVDRLIILYHHLRFCNGLAPVYLVETATVIL